MRKIIFLVTHLCGIFVINLILIPAYAVTPTTLYPWYVSGGTGYTFVSDQNDASGNISPVSRSRLGGDAIINHSSMNYTNQFSPEISVGYSVTNYFDLAVMFAQASTNINSGAVAGSGTDSGTNSAYTGQAMMNSLLVQPRLVWRNAVQLGRVTTSPYAGANMGATYMQLSSQFISSANNALTVVLANNTQWNFAWGGELGLINALSQRVDLTFGLRYLNYGNFSSGTREVNLVLFPRVTREVSATLYAVEPFVNLAYRF